VTIILKIAINRYRQSLDIRL